MFGTRNLAFVFLLFLAFSNSASAVSFESLKQLIQEKHIASIEALLPQLPKSFRSKYALLFRSRSLHGSSYSSPRVILYGDNASFILTFNGTADQKNFDALETMEFDEKTKSFLYREILFPENSKPGVAVSFSNPNPEKCLKCHGNPARPIWDTHPLWPGAYGERYHAVLSVQEQDGIKKFLASQPTNSRYSQLEGASVFAKRETFYPSSKSRYEADEKISPNEELSRLLSSLNIRRIVGLLHEARDFGFYKYALLASLNKDCDRIDLLVPESQRKLFQEKLNAFSALADKKNEEQEQLKKLRAISLEYKPDSIQATALVSLNSFRFLAEYGLGISTEEWTTALEAKTYDFSAPQNIELELENQLLRVAADPALASLASLRRVSTSDKYCSYLKKQSLVAINLASPNGRSILQTRAVASTQGSPVLLQKCISCHQGDEGPEIPFDHAQDLSRALSAGNYLRGSLFDEIIYRLSPDSGSDRMPRGLNISDAEKIELEKYFRTLKSMADSKANE